MLDGLGFIQSYILVIIWQCWTSLYEIKLLLPLATTKVVPKKAAKTSHVSAENNLATIEHCKFKLS